MSAPWQCTSQLYKLRKVDEDANCAVETPVRQRGTCSCRCLRPLCKCLGKRMTRARAFWNPFVWAPTAFTFSKSGAELPKRKAPLTYSDGILASRQSYDSRAFPNLKRAPDRFQKRQEPLGNLASTCSVRLCASIFIG